MKVWNLFIDAFIMRNLTVLSCFQSIVMPMYNASCWLDECLQAILHQDYTGTMELSVFDDASTVCLFLYAYKHTDLICHKI